MTLNAEEIDVNQDGRRRYRNFDFVIIFKT